MRAPGAGGSPSLFAVLSRVMRAVEQLRESWLPSCLEMGVAGEKEADDASPLSSGHIPAFVATKL
jgi:hypothetical protein